MNISKKVITFISILFLFFSLGCEDDETNDIAKAQKCLNENVGNTAALQTCDDGIQGYNSPRAKSIKCSVAFAAAGLTNDRVISAFEILDAEDNSSDNEKTKFMATVAVDSLPLAEEVVTICKNSNTPGKEFLANASWMGTAFASQLPSFEPGGEPPTQQEADDMLANCATDDDCKAVLGGSAQNMYDSYCIDVDEKDSEVCEDVNSAINQGGSNVDIGQRIVDRFNED